MLPVTRVISRGAPAAATCLVAAFLVVLAGCDGSGSGTPAPTAAPTLTRTPGGATATITVTRTNGVEPTATSTTSPPVPPTVTSTVEQGSPTSTATPGGATETPTTTPGAQTATPTRTPTSDPADTGPVVTFLGMVRPDGCRIGCFDGVCSCAETPTPIVDDLGREVFLAQGGGRGLLVIEGRPGRSRLPVGSVLEPDVPTERPDLQLYSDRELGNGSPTVCDKGPAPPIGTGGGVPAVDPPDYGEGQGLTDALTDFACRFAVQPSRDDACTLDNRGNFDFVHSSTTMQFCDQVSTVAAFPNGDTVITARLRDVAGNLGPPAHVVIRNPAAGPTPVP